MTHKSLQQIVRIALSITFYSISAFTIAHADTIVTGTIADGTVWTKAESPYVLSEQVGLPAGATLTVQPGTIVKVGTGASIEVYGTLQATGSEAEPITFTSVNDDTVGGDTNGDSTASTPTFGDWSGINFNNGSVGALTYVNLYYSWVGGSGATIAIDHNHYRYAELTIGGPGTATIKNSLFEDAHGFGIEIRPEIETAIENVTINRSKRTALIIAGSTVSLSNSTIINTDRGDIWSAIQLSENASLVMSGTTLDGGMNGIKLIGPNTLQALTSVIKNFSGTGILDTPGVFQVKANPIVRFASFITKAVATPVAGPTLVVSKTEITNNQIGMTIRPETTTSIEQNSIHGNALGAEAEMVKNNWWGDASGPFNAATNPNGKGDAVVDWSIAAPWLTQDPLKVPEITCCSSVAFIPGIEASRLYTGSGSKLWEPFGAADVKKLYLDSNGESLDKTIYTKDILDVFSAYNVYNKPIYKTFIQEMDGLVSSGTISSWKTFPYDWREAVTEVVSNGVALENGISHISQEIEVLAEKSKTGKVTIIAHSNGGLVTKALMIKLEAEGKASLVDKIIFVAVPQLGTPDAVKALLHGNPIENGFILGGVTARTFAENMPGAYGLIPSKKYFESIAKPIITFDKSIADATNFVTTYGSSISTSLGLTDFLLGKDGRTKPSEIYLSQPNIVNKKLLLSAEQIHDVLDSWQVPNGVSLVQIAGWGANTIQGIAYKAVYPCTKLIKTAICKPYLDEEPINTINGDETVVVPSAVAMNDEQAYFDIWSYSKSTKGNYGHAYMLEAKPVQSFIKARITGQSVDSPYITAEKPVTDTGESLHIAVHSPVTIDIYDSDANHTGLISNQTSDMALYEENVPNSYYMELGEGKYVGFDQNGGEKIKMQGSGTGTFTLVVEHKNGDIVKSAEVYADIPVTPETKAELVPAASTTTLSLDTDGNGTNDFVLNPTATEDESIDPLLYLQILRQTIHNFHLSPKIEKKILQRIDKVIALTKKDKNKHEEKDKDKMIIARIKQFSMMLRDKKWKQSKTMSEEQEEMIVESIEKLLDTIK